MDWKSKNKLKRFKKETQKEYKKLQIITEKEYNEIKRKVAPYIKNWEWLRRNYEFIRNYSWNRVDFTIIDFCVILILCNSYK